MLANILNRFWVQFEPNLKIENPLKCSHRFYHEIDENNWLVKLIYIKQLLLIESIIDVIDNWDVTSINSIIWFKPLKGCLGRDFKCGRPNPASIFFLASQKIVRIVSQIFIKNSGLKLDKLT